MSSQNVNQQLSNHLMMAQLSPIYGHAPKTPRRVKCLNARRKLVYPSHPVTYVRPEWNPLYASTPIYMSPPSMMSVYSNSLPRRPTGIQQQYPLSPMHVDCSYNSLRYQAQRPVVHTQPTAIQQTTTSYSNSYHNHSPRRMPSNHSTPNHQTAADGSPRYQKNNNSPKSNNSPRHKKYKSPRHPNKYDSRHQNNGDMINNNIYMTDSYGPRYL